MTRGSAWCFGLLACSGSNGVADGGASATDAGLLRPRVGASASALIGPEGGELNLDGVLVEVPAGALTEPTRVRVVSTDEGVPAGLTAYSPVLRFEPTDLDFALPIRVSIPFEGHARFATLFWKTRGADAYAALPTSAPSVVASADTTHLGRAFVGTGCVEGETCARGTGDVDVLFVIDNSGSTVFMHERIIAAAPTLLESLGSGDVDGDGVQDVAAARSVHFGIVSIDMGTGGHVVPTCSMPDGGDNGLLRTQGNTFVSGCSETYPSFFEFEPDASDYAPSTDDFSCVATIGVRGCGFEQPLESMLDALVPSSSSLDFWPGRGGHGDRENAGFLRDDASLAVVILMDEDDCSSADPALFDLSSPDYGDANLRCFRYPELLYPIARYVDGLLRLKSSPGRVVFSVIAGVPTDIDSHDPSVVIADPRMNATPDPGMTSRLTPVCNRDHLAMPAERLTRTAQAFVAAGAHAYVGSACEPDYTQIVRGVGAAIASSLGGAGGG
ncbi:MAG: hypothetical protein GXP55_08585 [Deltaproteobacteria bacterium]|nr:hypothetical protein [Deltaproteobacteria bacterium]